MWSGYLVNDYPNNKHLWDSYLRNDSLLSWVIATHHGIRFSGTGLPVRENAHVVPFKRVVHHLKPYFLIHHSLGSEPWIACLKQHRPFHFTKP